MRWPARLTPGMVAAVMAALLAAGPREARAEALSGTSTICGGRSAMSNTVEGM